MEQNYKAVQDMLDLFSFKCGLGCHRYNFELGKVTTATEYNGSRQDLVQSANKNQIPHRRRTDLHCSGDLVGPLKTYSKRTLTRTLHSVWIGMIVTSPMQRPE